MIALERILRRERAVVACGLVLVVTLAWAQLVLGAGLGMSAFDMTAMSLFPHMHAGSGGSMNTSLPVIVLMWWVMMVAMMMPGAAPLMLLYGAVLRRHTPSVASATGPTAALLAGYLLVWLAFSVTAALLQKALEPTGLISEMMLWSRSAFLSAIVLASAGIYQFLPLKHACLAQCRSPVRFLTAHWRPGFVGSLSLGLRHGAFCVGCCWMLMALLFVGGVMNLVWIAALSLLVLAEKLLPAGTVVAKVSGGLMLVWAAATLLV
jgi:predicted metal-binding membrane protein